MSSLEAVEAATAADLDLAVQRVAAAKTSFYTAMRWLPKRRREAMFAVYAFCRDVDDIADEPMSEDERAEGLARWRQSIATIYDGQLPTLPLARALVGPVRRFGLLQADLLAVIDGMQMDADQVIRAPSAAELDLYCARVAGAVGRLSVRIFGDWQPEADRVADALGRALQLTNILRDLDEDALRGRLYLPRELLDRHGIRGDDPALVLADPALPLVCAELARQAEGHFAAAAAAMRLCPRPAMRPAAMMGAVYRATLDRLVRRGWQPPRAPISVPKWLKLWLAVREGLL